MEMTPLSDMVRNYLGRSYYPSVHLWKNGGEAWNENYDNIFILAHFKGENFRHP